MAVKNGPTVGEANAELLFDLAVRRPDGFTWPEACDEFGWSKGQFEDAKVALRRMLADDTVNFPCNSRPKLKWLYKLSGTWTDGLQPWTTNRLDDVQTRLLSIEHIAQSAVAATDGRTADGRKARIVHTTLRYLREQLELI